MAQRRRESMEDWHEGPRHWYPHSLAFSSLADLDRSDLDVPSITKSIIGHVQTSLARQAYNLDDIGAYQAIALSVRDNLLVCSFSSIILISFFFFTYLLIVAQLE